MQYAFGKAEGKKSHCLYKRMTLRFLMNTQDVRPKTEFIWFRLECSYGVL
jgi:hypothetical protein